MTTPTDGVEGTQGKLFYWTRQGISLAEFQHQVELAIQRIQEAGGIAGITPLGMDLITAATQQAARDVIDAASTAQASSGGGGPGGAINLPIEISDVNNLQTTLDARALLSHHHSTADIEGLSTPVRSFLDAVNHAGIVTALALTPADLQGINDVGVAALTAGGATLTLRQAAFRAAVGSVGTKAELGLENVDNTADVDKPVPTAVQLSFARIRIPWKQVGSLYPTPLPSGFYGIAYEGVNDPADQAGLTVTNNDSWTQLQAVA